MCINEVLSQSFYLSQIPVTEFLLSFFLAAVTSFDIVPLAFVAFFKLHSLGKGGQLEETDL